MVLWEDELTETELINARVEEWNVKRDKEDSRFSLLESVAFWTFMVAFVAMVLAQFYVTSSAR